MIYQTSDRPDHLLTPQERREKHFPTLQRIKDLELARRAEYDGGFKGAYSKYEQDPNLI
jgi:hypothetical protein